MLACLAASGQPSRPPALAGAGVPLPTTVFGFRDFSTQSRWDAAFLPIPSLALAREHLRRLTSAPHWASSPQDYATAQYVASRFRAAGLDTRIVPYSVLMNQPVSVTVDANGSHGELLLHGPTSERLPPPTASPSAPPLDPTIPPPFNGSSPSGDVTGTVVYANYGRLSDFQRLTKMGISLKDRIVLVRYGGDFRGVKVFLAEHYGAAGVLIYSDPADGGARQGATYPEGRFRPGSAAQRGSVQFLPVYPGDPTTPGIASVPNLPASLRLSGEQLRHDIPNIPVTPISSADATPILRALAGPEAPHDWQGGIHLAYRVGGTSDVTVHLRLVQDTRLRTIWDVLGTLPGDTDPTHFVLAGNHRDAWVYGAADPGSGTAAMLEAVHGIGELRRHGWRPHRTVVFASWDAEEEGLVGSTEWAEGHTAELERAVAYVNMDVAVSGPSFSAGAVPSLRQFLREIAAEIPSPAGSSVFDHWQQEDSQPQPSNALDATAPIADPSSKAPDPRVGELGSGSDYTPFLQHLGVPSTDIASDGPFGVYHTPWDNFDWFTRFADPTFAYTRQQAQFFGLEVLHLASADVLPLDDQLYAREIQSYLDQARSRSLQLGLSLDFTAALNAAHRFEAAGAAILALQPGSSAYASSRQPAGVSPAVLDRALSAAERALLLPRGLPGRPWYRHSIYAPGEFTGYAAVVLPGVNEAIDADNTRRAQSQLDELAAALERAAAALRTGLPQGSAPPAH